MPGHVAPHPPQLFGSVLVSTQIPLQLARMVWFGPVGEQKHFPVPSHCCPAGHHGPQLIVTPRLIVNEPHCWPAGHVVGVQPQTFGVPPPPQPSPVEMLPQSLFAWQVFGVHSQTLAVPPPPHVWGGVHWLLVQQFPAKHWPLQQTSPLSHCPSLVHGEQVKFMLHSYC